MLESSRSFEMARLNKQTRDKGSTIDANCANAFRGGGKKKKTSCVLMIMINTNNNNMENSTCE
jgi:hypothetical protein